MEHARCACRKTSCLCHEQACMYEHERLRRQCCSRLQLHLCALFAQAPRTAVSNALGSTRDHRHATSQAPGAARGSSSSGSRHGVRAM